MDDKTQIAVNNLKLSIAAELLPELKVIEDALNQNEWIKVADRLPPDEMNVIACLGGSWVSKDGVEYNEAPFVDHNVYFRDGHFFWPAYHDRDYYNQISDGRIIAWMPLQAAPEQEV